MKSKVDLLEACKLLDEKGYDLYASHGTYKFLTDNNIKVTEVSWPDEDGDVNIKTMISDKKFDLIINIPKDVTKRELTNGYVIRRGAVDYNIPLITNARLASAFITAFCSLKLEDIKIKSWAEY
jgi:carbamoyl-phosphate synthase large subunit